jgi:hypothetical protein
VNPTFHRPLSVDVSPTESSAGLDTTDQFNLGLRYRPQGNTQVYLGVHVPAQLQPALLSGDVSGLHMETLAVNSSASRLLAGAPGYLILALKTRSGEDIVAVPSALRRARLQKLALGVTACICGGALVFSPYAWAGAIVFMLGSHGVRTAQELRFKPLEVFAEHR